VRKIISILVTVGLVMAFSVVAMPTTGAACGATVVLNSTCAGASTNYTIDFSAPTTIEPVNDMFSVEFGAGTTFGFLVDGDITVEVNGGGADAVDDIDDVVITGTKIEFAVPAASPIILPGDAVQLVIEHVVNPAVAGDYELALDYNLDCCGEVVFDCAEYTIIPAASTYGFFSSSNRTYDDDIAFDFVPPFKVCGQDTPFGGYALGDGSGKIMNYFDIYLMPTLVGCAGPCATDVQITLTLTAAPAGSNVTLDWDGGAYYFLLIDDDTTTEVDLGTVALGPATTIVWENALHFDAVGDYQICIEAVCPAGTPTCPDCTSEAVVVASKCFDFSVYQHKDATKIELFRKWNLISLPLVPLEDPNAIEDVLAAYDGPDVISVYYYDRCADAWSVWGDGQSSLTTLEDGKSYWVKVEYSHSDPTKAPGLLAGGLWVWGTPQPVPPNAPAAYPVCTGWNMVGLTGYGLMAPLVTTTDSAYLWNFAGAIGAIYAWDGSGQAWDALTVGGATMPDLQNGEGYWISFAAAGTVYPP